MKRTLTALLACLLTVGTVVLGAAPAHASGTSDPVFLSPTDGQTTAVNWTGPASVDFTDSPAGQYWVQLTNLDDDSVLSSNPLTVSEGDGVKSIPLNVPKPGHYDLLVDNADGLAGSRVQFTVPAYAPTLTGVTVAPATFYPRVHDGYADTTTMRYTLAHAPSPHLSVKVTNRAGTTIRSAAWTTNTGKWAWGGRKNDGTLAPTGDYKITLTATASGKTLRAAKWVTIATGHRYRTTTKTVDGDNGSRATSGDCTAMRDTYYGVMELDCSGGKYARATYGFTIPSNATNLSWKAPGSYPDYDMCCDGKVTKAGLRTTTTHYRVTVNVTGWRAYDVNYAKVTYTYRYAI